MYLLKRKEGESSLEYISRLINGKKEGLYDLDYVEMYELLFNKQISSTESRKRSYGILDALDLLEQEGINNISGSDILNDIEDKKQELYKQQVKTRDQLRELRSRLRDEARIENLKERFVECAEIISKEKPLSLAVYPKFENDKVGVLQLSDWHMGEIVDNFMNTYNKDIFDERIKKLTNDVVRYCMLMNVGVLKVLNCGDLISGGLHIGTRVTDEEDSVYQTMYVAEALANMLLEFARDINKVEFYSVTDNHSRVSRNKKEHIEQESFSRFIPWHLKTRLREVENVEIVDNKINGVNEYEIGMFDIFNEKAIFTHGHCDKIPSMVQNLTLMTKVFPVAIFTGHLHRNFEDEVHGIDLIMNPSAVGSGEYGKSIRKSSKARQKLTIYENNNGDVERISTFIINL